MHQIQVEESQIVKCHTDRHGQVWTIDGATSPAATGQSPVCYATHYAATRGGVVRVLGIPANAPLIASLGEQAKNHPGTLTVEVGFPTTNNWSKLSQRGPRETLMTMRSAPNLVPSLGGWQTLTDAMYPAYALAAILIPDMDPDATAFRLLASHPVWPLVKFIPHLDRGVLCHLIAKILDPRRFVDPENPDKDSRFNSYLGLSGRRARATGENAAARRALVLGAWKTDEWPHAEIDTPGYFLWRYWMLRDADRDVTTSQKFVRFLRENWLDCLSKHRQLHEPGQGLFIPKYYFERDSDIQAFEAHRKALCGY